MGNMLGGGVRYVYGSGIQEVDIVYRAKQNNCHADALFRQSVSGIATIEVTEAVVLVKKCSTEQAEQA